MSEAVAALLYPTVLIAEDSPDTLQMLKRAFELKGYRVLEATNGREALAKAHDFQPHLIVVDLNMPELDGLETIRFVRQLEGMGDQIPILAITAFDVYGMQDAAIEAGSNEYLRKPINLAELDRVLKHMGFVA